MADKSVGELVAATGVTPTDLFVLEQSGTAKKLTGQILENWLVSFADGHGGIQSIAKLSTSGLVDTYRITLADTTTFDFVVTNGRSITGISKTSTSGLVDTYTISYNDGTTGTFTIKNGEKGDKGDNAYIWIKYASQEPTESSHSMGDIPDDWIGIYSGNSSTAPTDWQQYKWYKIKGEKGDTGAPATITSQSVTYQVSDSGTIIPSGPWVAEVPVVTQGKFLWTKTELKFNTGDPIVSYSVARMGMDGSGSVSSVNNASPDESGNVTLTAADVGALDVSGGDMTGPINMNGQSISGLNDPVEDNQAARKGYVDASISKPNLLDNPWFTVNQRGTTAYTVGAYGVDRWKLVSGSATVTANGIVLNGTLRQILEQKPVGEVKASVKMYSGTGSASYDSTTGYFDITSSGGTVRAAKLEAGSVSTLGNDQTPNYAVELSKCQRYYQRFSSGTQTYFVFALGYMQSATSCRFFLPLTVPMRAKPTINSPEAVYFNYGPSSTRVAVSSFSVNNMLPNQVFLSSVTASDVTVGTVGEVMTTTGTGVVIELTADL